MADGDVVVIEDGEIMEEVQLNLINSSTHEYSNEVYSSCSEYLILASFAGVRGTWTHIFDEFRKSEQSTRCQPLLKTMLIPKVAAAAVYQCLRKPLVDEGVSVDRKIPLLMAMDSI